MRLTDFDSVVSTYKKNFRLRKKKFFNDKNQIRNEKRKEREENLETVRAVEPLIKTRTGKSTKSNNFLDGVYRFLGFALAGLVLSNLDSIISIASEIYDKIKEIKEGIENFVTSIQDTIDSFYSGFESFKQDLDNLVSPITSADLSGIVPFQEELGKVLTATLNVIDKIFGESEESSTPPLPQTRNLKPNIPGSGVRSVEPTSAKPTSSKISKFKLEQSRQNLTRTKLYRGTNFGKFKAPDIPRSSGVKPPPLLSSVSTTPSSSAIKPGINAAQLIKNMRSGIVSPGNLKYLINLGGGFIVSSVLDAVAMSAVNKGFEIVGMDDESIIQRNVKKYMEASDDNKIDYLKKLNNNLKKEIDYQKSSAFVIEKIIAMGGQVPSDKKIKILAGILSTIAALTGNDVLTFRTYAALPESMRSFITGSSPSTPSPSTQPTTSLISGLPSLPPTNTLPGGVQSYGASRAGGTRKHAGVDFDPADDKNSKFFSRIGGEVIFAGNVGGGYGNVVDIYNKELGHTERIAEGNRIHVKVGDIVEPGTLVQSGSEMTGVFHYEIRKGKAGKSGSFKGTVNPLEFLNNLKPPEEVSMRTPASNLISSAGLNQSTTYSEGGVALRREVNNIIIPIAA